jgi:hypothetical protein
MDYDTGSLKTTEYAGKIGWTAWNAIRHSLYSPDLVLLASPMKVDYRLHGQHFPGNDAVISAVRKLIT